MRNIAFIGMMGSGKTTIGGILSKMLRRKFFDLDSLIVEEQGIEISEIFKKHGEKYFRNLEYLKLTELIKQNDGLYILSLGGGAFTQKQVRDILKKNNIFTIWLKVSTDNLVNRIKGNSDRPLIQYNNLYNSIDIMLKHRNVNYNKADLIIDNNSNIEESIKNITYTLKR